MESQSFKPRLKPSLKYSLQMFGGETYCVLEDPLREQFWRLGPREFSLISQMSGQRSLAEVLQRANSGRTTGQLGSEDAEYLVAWLAREGLLQDVQAPRSPPAKRWHQRLSSTVFYRLRLGNPQPLLAALYPWLGGVTGIGFFLVWLALLLISGATAVTNWEELQSATWQVISPDQWLHYVLIWWGLKIVHELLHGLTCVRHGGFVPEAGILFILFVPLGAYVDVTSSWRFRSKWARMHVTFAGIYAELLVAAIALLVWAHSEAILVRTLALQTTLLASVATLLFNANPLIRFDGYYLLVDALELPNLYQRGQLAWRRFVSRVLFGHVPNRLRLDHHHRSLAFLYGLAALIWRYVLCLGILLMAAQLLDGAGLLLAWALAVVWFVLPPLQTLYSLLAATWSEPWRWLRALAMIVLLGFLLVWGSHRVQVPNFVVADGVARAEDSIRVRSSVAGEVQEVLVEPGQYVHADELLMVMDNPDLDLRLLRAKQELERSRLRRRQLLAERRVGEELAERAVEGELQQQLVELEAEREQLFVRAPQSGVILALEQDQLMGRYVRKGDELLRVGNPSCLEFAFSTTQRRHEQLREVDPQTLQLALFLPGEEPLEVPVSQLRWLPQVDWKLESPALAATQGGRVTLVQREQEGQPTTRTLEPRVHGLLEITEQPQCRPGTLGQLRLAYPSRSLFEITTNWLREQTREAVRRLSPGGSIRP